MSGSDSGRQVQRVNKRDLAQCFECYEKEEEKEKAWTKAEEFIE